MTTPTTPGAPTIGTGTSGNASASVTWTAPATNGGNAITGYVVTPYIAGTAQATQTFNTTATTETVTGLTNGTAYTFKVAAINGVGTGTQSAASNSVTPATTPGAPTIGTATSGNASATVTWTAPTVNGGSAITGYVVTPYITGTAQTAQTFNTTATTDTVTGLTNGTAYTFKVAAINGVGTGTQSAASNAVTPATTANAPTIGTATAGDRLGLGQLDGTDQQRRVGRDRLRGHPLHGGHGPGHPDLQHDGHHRHGDRTGQQHRLHLRRGRHQRRRHRDRLGPVQLRDHRYHAGSTHHRYRQQGQQPPRPRSAGRHPPPTVGRPSPDTWSPPTSAAPPRPPRPSIPRPPADTVTGLTNGQTYTFKVAAINAVGTGTQSAASASVNV